MPAEVRFSAGDAWVVCARCGIATNAHDDVVAAEDVVAEHAHSSGDLDTADLQTA